ncbi:B-cell receptor CD22-like isoform X2 [Paramisgurnus dabryanus]|uniref:B-cell receptor CD22-like isoform X2 n=1 Tax=Paramisgurnus dabryanus TaxID=90735 RepID=UPI0031F3A4DD
MMMMMMMMSIRMASLPLIFLLIVQGVYSADDESDVNYSPSSICALKGSTVIINCTYKYPTGHPINNTFWTKINSSDPPDLSEDSEYRQRIQYLGDKHHDCTMRLTDVRQTDSHKYYFRFTTDKNKWLGVPGVTLNITDLQVNSSGKEVTEGKSVNLTCKSRCRLTDRSTFIWFKNTQLLSERTDRNNQLILKSVTREDTGNYSCAVQGHKLISPHQYLNVVYAPNKPVISIKPSGEILEGDSVNLTCSSESNPPVQKYSWFKGNKTSYLGSGSTYIISKIRSDHSGKYLCRSRNELGPRYSEVTLNVLYPPKEVTASIGGSGEILEGDSVNLTCSSESNPPVQNYSWFKVNETSHVGSGQSYTIINFNSSHSEWFYCEAQNEVGSQRSAAVSVNVKVVSRVSFSATLGIGFCVGVCGASAFLIVGMFICRRKSLRRKDSEQTPEKDDDASNDTYTALELKNRSSDLYDTLTPKQRC